MTITKMRDRTFVGDKCTPLISSMPRREKRIALLRGKNKDADGATSARRKNPPYKSLSAGTRVDRNRDRDRARDR